MKRQMSILFVVIILLPTVALCQGVTLSASNSSDATDRTSIPISHQKSYAIGLRDPIALALQLGTFSGVSADVRVLRFNDIGFAVEGAWGIDISAWGLGVGWNADIRMDIVESDDGQNDAFVLEPVVGYGQMLALGGSHGWDDFFKEVHFITLTCALAWVHEFDFDVASDLSLRPGMYFASQKQANLSESALSNRTFQINLVSAIRF